MRFSLLFTAPVLLAIVSAGCSKELEAPNADSIDALNFEERLLFAVRTGELDVLQKAIDEYPDVVHEMSSGGQTLLHQAVMVSQPKSVQFLLEHGADPNALNVDDDTPLDVAREVGADPEVSKILRDAGGH